MGWNPGISRKKLARWKAQYLSPGYDFDKLRFTSHLCVVLFFQCPQVVKKDGRLEGNFSAKEGRRTRAIS